MKTILLEGDDVTVMKLIIELAQKLKLKVRILNAEEKEDFALANAMVKEETGEYLSQEELLKELAK